MAKRRFSDLTFSEEEEFFLTSDPADQAFWDEFWTQEASMNEDTPLVTITVRNEETGEERVLEHVRLRYRAMKKLRDW
ncbi:MAG: hypothetical protein A2900_06085 [Candidatus Chisholmbacteria bacterium RIFCSPLOWO2_01_FULL_50_28]|uniref:Uncharacterized protein n=1 Tax=Candidatus Chisholmbacteria bacterium RIFCSPHIGHO2_01_FULL_52_32 TaxID=1797591 RepID=A0A1G1VR39_9BACT|nr:MAG: hypothetical protein A2786_00460 [Candidatus Chisholmbacteria bacterium RIFCSPHIGHO2_01_FULL_52_32]OGY20685.1 MAG: hypothetical protein A2900_06085 [Candidatus Chisholmbacteria bacterium RIFCSPLOWO2_01_FULL_50_28]